MALKSLTRSLQHTGNLLRQQTYQFSRRNRSTQYRSEYLDPVQVKFLSEKCIAVDINDNILSWKTKVDCHNLQCGPYLHRAFSVFLFNTKNQLLMHRRSKEKIIFPGYYTNSCCSHPLYDIFETQENNQLGIKNAARRRLNYELGISYNQIILEDLKFVTRIHYTANCSSNWGECEIDYILFLRADVDLNINLNEISEVQYVNREDMPYFIKHCNDNRIPISHWFQICYDNYLDEWWKNIDNIEQYQDNLIHRHIT